jgi:hypothetical protein
MAYTKTIWAERQGTNLTRFAKSAETPTSVNLTPAPTITKAGTPFSAEHMNKIEQGIYEAHQGITDLSDTLTAHADMVDGMGRNLLDVLGVGSIQAAMAALRVRCNGTGVPDFRGLMIGDYLDGINLSAIPAENGGDAGQAWSNTYKNNRIVISAFNPYKGIGAARVTKNHIRFDFANIPLRKLMNSAKTNAGGYLASELRAFLEGTNGDGTGSIEGVTTAAFLNALKAQLGDYILTILMLLSENNSVAWKPFSLWPPSENEVFGVNTFGDPRYDMQKLHIPLYQKSFAYRLKRYNGAQSDWYLNSPRSDSERHFCVSHPYGIVFYDSSANPTACGISPAFCVA